MIEKRLKRTKKSSSRKEPQDRDYEYYEDHHYKYDMDEEMERMPKRQRREPPYRKTRGPRDRRDDRNERETPDEREVHYHYYYEPPRHSKKRSSKPGIAGALLIITAILGLIFGSMIIVGGEVVGDFGEGMSFWGMAENGDVSGRVTYKNGTPVVNATVSIVDEPISTQTDDYGNYLLYNVPTGNQKIKVEKEGYNTIIYKLFVSPSDAEWKDKNGKHEWESDNEKDFKLTPGDQEIEMGEYPPWELFQTIMTICGILALVFSVFVLLGGYFALQRKNFMFALIGAILGIFTFGFIIGSLFALIALFILIISRDEFKASEVQE